MTNRIKLKGKHTDGIDLTADTLTNVLALTDGVGCTVGTLTNDTIGTTAEDGFLTITVSGTTYKIPFWQDN